MLQGKKKSIDQMIKGREFTFCQNFDIFLEIYSFIIFLFFIFLKFTLDELMYSNEYFFNCFS